MLHHWFSRLPQNPSQSQNYQHLRVRVMYSMMIGYAVFYFVRKNISIATKSITDEFGFSNTEWGMVLSAATIVYAFSKLLSGIAADRISPRKLMAIGLGSSAVLNILFGFGHSLSFFIIIWAANSLFQGMGMPPCSRLLVNWFSQKTLGRAWGVWNASHQIGGAIIVVFAGYLVANYGWRYAFWIPAAIALVVTFGLYFWLIDEPGDRGLPPVEVFERSQGSQDTVAAVDKPDASNQQTTASQAGSNQIWHPSDAPEERLSAVLYHQILCNKWLWVVCLANFFVYIVRIGILDWAPKYLEEAKGFNIMEAGMIVSVFELAGIVGAYYSGWLSDGPFKGFRGRVSVLFMAVLVLAVIALLVIPAGQPLWMSLVFVAIGFFVYGPQMLIAVAAADFTSSSAAATAVGLTGLWGYLGASVCGLGTGVLVDHFGWQAAIYFYLISAIVGMVLLAMTWNKSVAK